MLKGKKILLGICGGIAAYKICLLIRKFKQSGANVQIVATKNALNFITKVTLQTLSQNEVKIEEFDVKNFSPEHISFADSSDIMVIAPATANTISKIANGICDNLLTSIACAFTKQIVFAPAMNTNMWKNPIIQKNLQILKNRGYNICDPESGFLACGYNGQGRLCSIDKIFDRVVEIFENSTRLKNKKIVITAGGTREKIDTVRFLSNYSSGKMGIALADEAYNQGADVVLITTVNVEKPYKTIFVESALDMFSAVEKEFLFVSNESFDKNTNKYADILIMAAAVADYRVKEILDKKLKKTESDELNLTFVKNPDILKEICAKKHQNQTVIGFCAESENLINFAKEKIEKKGCDFLVANDISRKDTGFSSDYNEVFILDKNGDIIKIEKALKKDIAKEILKKL